MKWIKTLMKTATVCLCANFILISPVMAAPDEGLDNAALERLIRERTATPAVRTGDDASDLIMNAMGLLGVAYHFGGNSPTSGLDCSGFMQYIFRRSMGVTLPRSSRQMATVGEAVSRTSLQPGDLVFFSPGGGGISHVGMYIGNGRMIHAPRTGKNIEITSIEQGYWSRAFVTARRVKH
ncbi:C40 family peptidase [Snodgrassella alvi]|uniref:C40 family peptidase n=1 Tax=Snodgrassella alvi TaxID=1196083 RepID=UPI000C1F669B|nr:C40 family peptidase [Snodgrassella alvi]WLT05104.1 C40 family peptidase [Snodgrassella alvi]